MTASLKVIRESIEEAGYYIGHAEEQESLFAQLVGLGEPVSDQRAPDLYRVISPTTQAESLPNTLGSLYGLGVYPFHTDTAYWRRPASFVVLHCIDPGKGERRTIVTDTAAWKFSANEKRILTRELWLVAAKKKFLATIAEQSSASIRYRWDRDCMSPLSEDAARAGDLMEQKIDSSDRQKIEWRAGKFLVVDNARCLHSRGSAKAVDSDRKLGRILIGGR